MFLTLLAPQGTTPPPVTPPDQRKSGGNAKEVWLKILADRRKAEREKQQRERREEQLKRKEAERHISVSSCSYLGFLRSECEVIYSPSEVKNKATKVDKAALKAALLEAYDEV